MPVTPSTTYESILQELANLLDGPISMDELLRQVLERKPSTAKNPRTIVRERLRWIYPRPFVFLDSKTLLPTRLAMQGARFRLSIGQPTAIRGLIEARWFQDYLLRNFDPQKMRFTDSQGNLLPVRYKTVVERKETILGTIKDSVVYIDLGTWLRRQNVARHDDLLVTVLDWQNGVFRLEIESHKKSPIRLIQERDRLLADLLYQILEEAYYQYVKTDEAIPLAYARLPDKDGCPPHHWMIVLNQDGRFRADQYTISYFDAPLPPFQAMILEQMGESPPRRLQPVTEEQRTLVYRFKVVLHHAPEVWREVEILGGQTLGDLNRVLRSAFHHNLEHLAGFWKIVPRQGKKIRYREVDLGTVDPLGGGSAANVEIAALGLKEGDQLKYVFDFSDWLEHSLTLESISPAEPGVKYPRHLKNMPT